MKPINMFLNQKKAIAAIVIWSLLATVSPQVFAQESVAGPDVVVTIKRLTEALDLIDRFVGDGQNQSGGSPTAIARGSLMGTAWIDQARPIVVAFSFKDGATAAAAFVPFMQPNPDFQSAYKAKSGPDYYVIALPPNSQMTVSASDEAALLAASVFPQEKLVSVKASVGRLIAANAEKIDQMIAGIEIPPPETSTERPAPPFTTEEARRMVADSLALFKQVDTFVLEFDLNQETLSLGYQVLAVADSRLAEVLAAGGKTSLLGDLPVEEQVAFSSRSYNLTGMLGLIGETLGGIYKKMGVDFAGLEKISKSFTGDMLGGMSLAEDRIEFEFMALLNENISPDDFLEKEYIPWLLEYGKQMSALAESAPNAKPSDAITRTPESTVKGHRVLGCRVAIPASAFPGPVGAIQSPLPISTYDMRLTTSGRVLVVASNDTRVAKLLEKAKNIAAQPASGPLMTGEVDLAGYLGALRGWVQQTGGVMPPLPKLGRMLFQGDMGDGQASFEMSVRLKDIQSLIAYTAAMAPSAESKVDRPAGAGATEKTSEARSVQAAKTEAKPRPGTLKVPPEKEGVPIKKDAEYWATRAYLCTTYGNDKAAIDFFKKAIALSPNSSNLYFQMGISYGELGNYPAALSAIDKAMALGGDKGLYYYGRGRVLLLSGNQAKGLADIEKAAEMGELDAIKYMQGLAEKPAS